MFLLQWFLRSRTHGSLQELTRSCRSDGEKQEDGVQPSTTGESVDGAGNNLANADGRGAEWAQQSKPHGS